MPKITKILLTGGPRAGKTTAKAHLTEFVRSNPSLNCEILFVSETAQDIIESGIRPCKTIPRHDFQRMLVKHQFFKENLYGEAAKNIEADNVLIVFDRGIMDTKAFIPEEEFNDIISEIGLKNDELKNRYDFVIHLETAAKSNPEIYNKYRDGRDEGINDAIEQDNALIDAWKDYDYCRIIISNDNFEQKMLDVINEVAAFMKWTVTAKAKEKICQKKYLIAYPNIKKLEAIPGVQKLSLIQTYLNVSDDKEVRIRAIGNNGKYDFVKTTKISLNRNDPLNRITSKEILSESKYISLLSEDADSNYRTTKKTRYVFSYDRKQFSIDLYSIPNRTGTAILEVNLADSTEKPKLPDWIDVYEDVSNNPEYKDASLAKSNVTGREVLDETSKDSKQLFISYSSCNADFANTLVSMLENKGYSCWIAPRSIPGGQDYTSSIPKAIRESDAIIFLISLDSQKSEWCQDELQEAKSKRKPIIPINIDGTELTDNISFSLKRCQIICVSDDFDLLIKELLKSLDNLD